MSQRAYVTPETLPTSTERWLRQIAPYHHHTLKLNADEAALLVIDMQNYFVDLQGRSFFPAATAILPNIKQLIEAFRHAGRPVIYTTHVHKPDGSDVGIMGWWWGDMIREGYPEAEVHPEIAPSKDDKVIIKHRYSAFYNTDLETVLRCGKIGDLVITGVMTNLCCESTARDAYFRDYRVFFLADATATISEEMHLATLLNLGYGFASIRRTADILVDF
jgi:nicotinamidase-related amidase